MCKQMGLSQQKLADLLDVGRGKVAGYFYETQAKPDFHDKLREKFHLDLGKFLTIQMNDFNYNSFFDNYDQGDLVSEPKSTYSKSDIINLLLKAKKSSSTEERNQLIDEAIVLYGKIMDENSQLKDELVDSLRRRS